MQRDSAQGHARTRWILLDSAVPGNKQDKGTHRESLATTQALHASASIHHGIERLKINQSQQLLHTTRCAFPWSRRSERAQLLLFRVVSSHHPSEEILIPRSIVTTRFVCFEYMLFHLFVVFACEVACARSLYFGGVGRRAHTLSLHLVPPCLCSIWTVAMRVAFNRARK